MIDLYNLKAMRNKELHPEHMEQSTSSGPMYSPQSSLRIMREIGLGQVGSQKLRNRVTKEGKTALFPSKRKLDFARSELEQGCEYIVDDLEVVRLKSIPLAVNKRLANFDPGNRKVLLSVDKGQG